MKVSKSIMKAFFSPPPPPYKNIRALQCQKGQDQKRQDQKEQSQTQKGFSLIELMVVIVIIGVLANVGIPRYQTFMMKARRSEVKSLLTSMYAAQKSFYAEWDQYYADFDVVGFSLAGDQRYLVGFHDNRGPGIPFYPDTIYRNDSSAVIINTKSYCDKTPPPCTYDSTGATVINIPGSAVVAELSGQTFIFGGAANLDTDRACDRWYITDTRELTLLHDDINWSGRNLVNSYEVCEVAP